MIAESAKASGKLSIQIAAASTLLGWALLHLFWDVPYRSFLWSENLSSGWVRALLGMSWKDYATSGAVDQSIQFLMRSIGAVLLLASAAAVIARRRAPSLLLTGSGILLVVSLLLYKESGYQLAMLVEYAAQVTAPVLLFLACSPAVRAARVFPLLQLAVAFTFFGHGLYAIGYHPMPGNFIDMTMSILGLSEPHARVALRAAGVMDMIVAVAIFVPAAARPALLYAAVWGLLTALARPVHQIALGGDLSSVVYWSVEALCRVPHAALPAAAWLWLKAGVISEDELGILDRRISSRSYRTTGERLSSRT